jgi:hypothetical protein
MRTWPAVLAAPVLALVDQSVAYALVPWSCSHQGSLLLHATHAVFLVVTLATIVPAAMRLQPASPPSSPDEQGERRRFFGFVGISIGAFSALVIAAMWGMLWFLPPCAS